MAGDAGYYTVNLVFVSKILGTYMTAMRSTDRDLIVAPEPVRFVILIGEDRFSFRECGGNDL